MGFRDLKNGLIQNFYIQVCCRHTWAGEKSLGFFCLYLYVISFDFDSGVGIPVTLTFWSGGGVNTIENPPGPMRGCRGPLEEATEEFFKTYTTRYWR